MMKRLGPLTRRWALVLGTIVLCAATLPGANWTAAPIDPAVVSGGYALVRVAHGAAGSVAKAARAAGASEVAALDAIDMVTAVVTPDALRAIRFDARVKFIGADTVVRAADKDGEFEKDDDKDKDDKKDKRRGNSVILSLGDGASESLRRQIAEGIGRVPRVEGTRGAP